MRARALFALLLLPAPAFAAGTTGADVLKARTGARAAALGEAYAALGDDVSAIGYNPAGLASVPSASLSFLHFAQVAGVSLENVTYAQPFDFGTLGADVVFRTQPDIANPLAVDAPVSAYDLIFGLAYAVKPGQWFPDLPGALAQAQAGVTLKYVGSHLGRYDAFSVAADVGLRAPLGEGIMGGLSILNLGPPIKFIDVADPLPATILGGISRGFDPILGNRFTVTGDLEAPLQGTMRLHVGLEDWLGKVLALRGGYLLDNGQSLNGFTGGFGVRLDQEGLIFRLDYALRPFYYQGLSSFELQHLFQITLTF